MTALVGQFQINSMGRKPRITEKYVISFSQSSSHLDKLELCVVDSPTTLSCTLPRQFMYLRFLELTSHLREQQAVGIMRKELAGNRERNTEPRSTNGSGRLQILAVVRRKQWCVC
jgi:hypothetical protein